MAFLANSYLKGIIILANFGIMLFVATANQEAITRFNAIYLSIVFFTLLQVACAVEMLVTFWALPMERIVATRQVIIIEAVLQVIGLIAFWNLASLEFETMRFGMRRFEMILVVRNVRIGTLLKEIQIFKNMHDFFNKMTKPMLVMFASMYFFFYCFAVVGNAWLGGRVTNQSAQVEDPGVPGLYYTLNFNDLAASLVSLFTFMILAGWWPMTNMYIDIVGNQWPLVFFCVFFVVIELTVLNLVIAIILEIYTSVEGNVE